MIKYVLDRALAVKRQSGSNEEAAFVAWLASEFKATMIDEAGNLHFDYRQGESRTLFTAHSDTCHRGKGLNTYTVEGSTYRASGDVLGADDGAGIAIAMHLLEHNVPCYVIIFREEEVGGLGSSWLARANPELLKEFDRAIAFDRAGYGDVISHQGGRCASDEFCSALAGQLNLLDEDFMFAPDDTGVFTDTANLTDLIPECTNISVGYFAQHTGNETQDVAFLQKLGDAVLKIDWERLPTDRNPSEITDNTLLEDILIDEISFSMGDADQESLLELVTSIVDPDMSTLNVYPRVWTDSQLKWALQSLKEGCPAEIVAEDLLYVLDVTTGEFE